MNSFGFNEVLTFWFKEIKPSQWWLKDPTFDESVSNRFSGLHCRANACELFRWRKTAEGRLAEIIILDQFSRNMFRDTARAFASDSLALALAQEAVGQGADLELKDQEKGFLYMPFMHSESIEIHEMAMELFAQKGLEKNLDFEKRHFEIIRRFGRYPHRNQALGRISTPEEVEFLKLPGSSF